MPKTYTVKQVAEILGFSTNSIYAFLKAKRINGVRVGKGRFRIPETELARVLHLSKKTIETPSQRLPEEHPQPAVLFGRFGRRFSLPNIFDWFVGLSAIVSGVALFLFNQTTQTSSGFSLGTALPAVRVILIAAGLGVLVSDMLPKSGVWHRLFLAVLSVMGLYNAYSLWGGGDVDGVFIYGVLAFWVGINAFVHLGGVIALMVYLSALAVIAPFVIWLGGADYQIQTLLSYVHMTPPTGAVVVGAFSTVFLVTVWLGYRRVRYFFWIACWLEAAGFFAAALVNAQLLFWSRSFFLLTLGFFTAFLPIWRSFKYRAGRRERLLLHGLFASVGIVLITSLLVVYVMQKQSWEQNRQEFTNKLAYAQTLMSTSLESVKSTLVAASVNPELRNAVVQGDIEKIMALSRVLYEANTNIRRIVYLNAEGDGIALYPIGTFDQPNLAFRDYFRKVRDTRALYVSDVFEALVDNEQRKVVAVAVPLIDGKGVFLGAMVGSVDLMRLGGKLQNVAVGARGEYFLVVDREGKVVISPETQDIGRQIEQRDVLSRGLVGEQGVALAKLSDGTLGMAAYGPLAPYGWALSLRAPASRVYALGQQAILSVFGVIGVVILATLVFMVFLHMRLHHMPRESSP